MRKSVLITGCSSGFGRELVSLYLQDGWTVIASLRNLERRRSDFDSERQNYPHQLHLLELDVTSASDRQKTYEFIQRQLNGKLDCLINNAGYGVFGSLEDVSENQIRNQFETNFFGLVFLTRKLLPFLRNSKGLVINISSTLGYIGMPLTSLYSSSKFAVEGISECLYYELERHGVRVSLVEPGQFRTLFGPNRDWAEKSDSESSAYFHQTRMYKQRLAERRNKVSPPSSYASRKIVKLSSQKRMPLRVRMGFDAELAYLTRKLLPQRLADRLLSWAYRKIFS